MFGFGLLSACAGSSPSSIVPSTPTGAIKSISQATVHDGAGGGGSGFVKAGGTNVKMLPSDNRGDGYIEIITEP